MNNIDLSFYLDDDAETNLWQSYVQDIDNEAVQKLSSGKSILVLGDSESGKSSLVAKLQGVEHQQRCSVIEYLYLNVIDDIREDQTQLGVWILDSKKSYQPLLRYALSEQNVQQTCVMMCVSMEHPQQIMSTLENLSSIIEDHITSMKLPESQRMQMHDDLVSDFKRYRLPSSSDSTSAIMDTQEAELASLGDQVLVNNLGLPIIVVVTKSDYIAKLESENSLTLQAEHFDYIQQQLRLFCLRHGASLIYTSVKGEQNCNLLRRYIMHRSYDLPFTLPCNIVDRESVFVPAGWDSKNKIDILSENFTNISANSAFEDVIKLRTSKKLANTESEPELDNMAKFLTKVQDVIQKHTVNTSPNQQKTSDKVLYSSAVPSTAATIRSSPSAGRIAGNKQMDTNKMGESVLASFFNSLIKKNGNNGDEVEREALARDASAELNKIQKRTTTNTAESGDVATSK